MSDTPSSATRDANESRRPTRVWDLPTRLFHWSLAVLVAFNAVTGKFAADLGSDWMARHLFAGYAVLTLVLFRFAWGFVGNQHARFAGFVRGPRAVFAYAAALRRGDATASHAGHNPLGGWSVLAMLGALSLQIGSGLFLADEDLGVEAPLAKHVANRTIDLLHAVHASTFWLLLALVALHVAAIVYYRIAKRDNLVAAMVSGNKPLAGIADARGGAVWLGALVLAIAAAAVGYFVTHA